MGALYVISVFGLSGRQEQATILVDCISTTAYEARAGAEVSKSRIDQHSRY